MSSEEVEQQVTHDPQDDYGRNKHEALHRRLNDESSAIPHETQYTISAWSKKTFGPKDPLTIAKRARVEFNEMIDELEVLEVLQAEGLRPYSVQVATRAAAVEAADVVIMLYSVVSGLKHDIMALIDEKMVVNRGRSWHTDPTTGRTQHIPGTGELFPARLEVKAPGDWQVQGVVVHNGVDFVEPGVDYVKTLVGGDTVHAIDAKLVAPTTFKEPGSGLTMQRDRWYILSDSGSSYSPYGFRTADEAREWFASPAARDLYGGELKLAQPSYLPPTDEDKVHGECGGWDDEWEAANVLLGLDLVNFWLSNDRQLFMELNPGFEK